jgi:hypothetical protein
MNANEALLRLMNLPPCRFDGVVRTSDGFYLGRVKGDLGYNAFLGKPKPPHPGPGRDLTLNTWGKLTPTERRAVLALAANPPDGAPILLAEDFGVPVEEAGEGEEA